jgi:hypothetical protein
MGRWAGSGRNTCESCISIDVRLWQRQGRLRGHQCFSWSWKCGGEPSGNINVRTEEHTVVLIYRIRSYGETEWKDIRLLARIDNPKRRRYDRRRSYWP